MPGARDKMCCPGKSFTSFWLHTVYSAINVCTSTTGCSDIFPWYECWYFPGQWPYGPTLLLRFLSLGNNRLISFEIGLFVIWRPSYDDTMIILWRWVDEHRLPGLFAFRKWFSCPKSSNNGEKFRWRADYNRKWKVEQYSALRRIRNEKATTTGSIMFGSSKANNWDWSKTCC